MRGKCIMSSPCTPSRLREASTGVSTPSSDHGTTVPDQTTPRSRVKAMLAALDEDSDDGVPLTHTKLFNANTMSSGESIPNEASRSTTGKPVEDTEQSESDGGEDSDMMRPRGKVAARLHGVNTTDRDAEASGTTTAYDRIKQQLLAKKPETSSETLSDEDEPIHLGGIKLTGNILQRRKRPVVVESGGSQSSSKSSSHQSLSYESSPTEGHMIQTPFNKRHSSPGLFCTPNPTSSPIPGQNLNGSDDSDSDLQGNDQAKARLYALVDKKRAERQAKTAAEEQKQAERRSNATAWTSNLGALSEDDIEDDSSTENKLTQQARPTRKASKKALEEMNRETQRMSRNMQLAHQAKTKKKVTKESLMARFNFRCNPTSPATALQTSNSSTAVNSDPVSDTEAIANRQTPPTSPLKPYDELESFDKDVLLPSKKQERNAVTLQENDDLQAYVAEEDFLSVEEIMSSFRPRLDKGKAKAVERTDLSPTKVLPKVMKTKFSQPSIRVRPPKVADHCNELTFDLDDDELDIVRVSTVRTKKLDVFDKLQPKKATEGRSLQTLRALAHLTSPGKRNDKSKASMTSGEMQSSLQRRARQQAAKERSEKIQELRDQGHVILTAKERREDQAEIEGLLEKARREGAELTMKEKDAAKKERGQNGIEDDSSDEDDDYEEEEAGVPDLELSGSDEEADGGDQETLDEDSDEEEADDDEDDRRETGSVVISDNELNAATFLRTEAIEEEESENTSDEGDDEIEDEDMDENLPAIRSKRRHKPNRILDDEDEESVTMAAEPSPEKPRNPFATYLPGLDDTPMGLTQAFEATMADTQWQQGRTTVRESEVDQDSLSFLRAMPDPDFPMLETQQSETMVPDSQTGEQSFPQLDLHFSQSQIEHDSLPVATQYSEIPDPTQDAGFESLLPLVERFVSVPPSTMDTVLLQGAAESKTFVERKKGRLRRRGSAVRVFSDEEGIDEDDGSVQTNVERGKFKLSTDAFGAMKKASKRSRVVESFDKKKSDAKGMVEEQAEESEDEYAGLGGASDDESNAEEDEEVRKMIDEGDVKVDERKLAAFYAYVLLSALPTIDLLTLSV